jgi:hypothetical protein
MSVAVKNGAILAGPAWRPGRFAFGLFPAEVPLVSQVAGAPTCQPGDVSAPTTSARVVLVVLPKWPLRALPLTLQYKLVAVARLADAVQQPFQCVSGQDEIEILMGLPRYSEKPFPH